MSTEKVAAAMGAGQYAKPLEDVCIQDLREHLEPRNGGLMWTKKTGQKVVPGRMVPHSLHHRYDSVRFRGRLYYVHRVVFAIVHGRWPHGDVDHIDGDPRNNDPKNLREATRAQNCANKRSSGRGTSGRIGVFWAAHAKSWVARICKDGRNRHLGYFKEFNEACAARELAEVELYGPYRYRHEH